MLKKILICFSLLLIITIGISYYSYEKNQFPNIDIGLYRGEILINQDQPFVFILAKPLTDNTLIFSPFRESWSSKKIQLKSYNEDYFDSIRRLLSLSIPDYYALEFSQKDNFYKFRGIVADHNLFSGEILENNNVIGTWKMSKIENFTSQPHAANLDFVASKIIQKKYAQQKLKIRELQKENLVENMRELERLLLEPQTLESKRNSYDDFLNKQLSKLEQSLTDTQESIAKLAGELSLSMRITTRGKSINLAKQITERENRWYLEHWQEEVTQAAESSAVRSLGIDASALKSALKNAREIRRLRLEKIKEEQRISELLAIQERLLLEQDKKEEIQEKQEKRRGILWF